MITVIPDRYQWPRAIKVYDTDQYQQSPIGRLWSSMVAISDQWSPRLPKEDLRTHALLSQAICVHKGHMHG